MRTLKRYSVILFLSVSFLQCSKVDDPEFAGIVTDSLDASLISINSVRCEAIGNNSHNGDLFLFTVPYEVGGDIWVAEVSLTGTFSEGTIIDVDSVTIYGVTTTEVVFEYCIHFGDIEDPYTEISVLLTDNNGKSSNPSIGKVHNPESN